MEILVITFWSYREGLIQAYTLPYIRIFSKYLPPGSKIHLVTLEKESTFWKESDPERVRELLLAEHINWVPFRYQPFGWRSAFAWMGMLFRLMSITLRRNLSTIHCWATPAGAMGYLLAHLKRVRLIIDSYEPHAEAMVENGTWPAGGLKFRLLFWLERRLTRRADAVIAATEGMREYASRNFGVDSANFYVKPACVDMAKFAHAPRKSAEWMARFGLEHKIVCVYAGKLGGIYLKEEVFEMLECAHAYWGDRFRALLLVDLPRAEIESLCLAAGLPPDVVISTPVPYAQIPVCLKLGDFALTPVKPVPTKRYCTPIKDGEYWAAGLPVVIPSGISDDAGIIEANNLGFVLHALNREEYKKAFVHIDELLKHPENVALRIQTIARQVRGFEIAESVYTKIYRQER